MQLIHHVVTGNASPAVVFVHGFACASSDWDAQVAHLSPRHQTVAVDLRGHGKTPGMPAECAIERYGADVADVMHSLGLGPAVLVGHSMGCRVVIEAALQAPQQTARLVLVDGNPFAPGMASTLKEIFASKDGYINLVDRWFRDMFTASSDPAIAAFVLQRARRMPRAIGERLLPDMERYDTSRFASSLADLRVPVMAVQCTWSNEKRERRSMTDGQTTPYLDMLRARVPSIRIEIIPDTGHFPQIDNSAQTNNLLDRFLPSGQY
jgi:pimeloyl-ACP methyl ester carboxylesterase